MPNSNVGRSAVYTPATILSYLDVASIRNDFYDRSDTYDYLWSYYANTAYDSLSVVWNAVRARNRIYRHTRGIFNPVRRLVDFYAGVVWQGVMSANSDDYPMDTRFAIPLPEKVPSELRAAIDQIFLWSNFSAQRYTLLRYGAALGNVLVEIVDDVTVGKVTFDIVWPAYVKDLVLDYGGHVKKYAIEYKYEDVEDGKEYTYRREVNRDTISTFRNGEPYSYYGAPASYPNPYGFAPAVWISHSNIGSLFGMPAARNITKLDELNSIVSHVNDQMNKILASPVILAMHNPEAPLPEPPTEVEKPTFGGATSREDINFIEANIGAHAETVSLPAGQALEHVRLLLEEIERDTPELSVWAHVRDKVQVSGIAVEYLTGDAAIYVSEAQQNYDTALIRMLQMGISVAGMRQKEAFGGWALQTYQQEKFSPYTLDSYKDGDLDFIILPRPMISPTPTQAAQLRILTMQADKLEKEMNQPQTAAAGVDAGQSVNAAQGIFGSLARAGLGNGAGAPAQDVPSKA